MNEPLFLRPVFHEKIWGGTRLHSRFNYDIPSVQTGECWGISGHPNGLTHVMNGPFSGMALDTLWHRHAELFGNKDTSGAFPLLVKILDAHDNLSIQVHPANQYAATHAHELGKTECWYIIAAEPGSVLYYGHNATSRQQLNDWVDQGDWDKLLRKIPIHAGQFVYVPAGTIHALGKGVLALETQQSSDTTYRLYDFDRVSPKTHQKRHLDIADALNVISVPQVDPQLKRTTTTREDATLTTFIKSPYFGVYQWLLPTGSCHFDQPQTSFTLVSVLHGTGRLTIDDTTYPLKTGDHLILPSTIQHWTVTGEALEIIASTPGPKIV
ncbi:mannose-6-phosphate isomerase [Levilactobacillus koreensis JCM 16448]|uniref:Mannose-6-phosphate isomerase n=1 Tax=Levilactobacillus koreensis TaxID=637971 RepID=A0AAC8UWV3_9LACO|nr:mannose-6-phosphate isomerase, class I [Levilactobacillus koreensis]AKP64939.1 mannose-6-phosphate isomerase [Levilactobacillus koreensis]KRK91285.1 mannose-6-phosphate isomerase [Levilactobacillus koreensis JCM 16448]